MPVLTVFILVAITIVFVVVARILALRVVIFIVEVVPLLPKIFMGSQAWERSRSFRSRLARGYPALVAFFARRIEPRQPTGLLLTLTGLAAIYLAGLFSGLTEDILEASGTIRIDNVINAGLVQWRVEPLISAFLWITALGSSPSVIAAVIIATGFLWSERRFHIIPPLWVTCLGALMTTTIGKLVIGRHRPEFTIDVSAAGWSFPSGHATVAVAAYGFVAYAIARTLPGIRERFEVAYWTAVLIVLIGLSRIFLGVHYVTDVIGGFLVGGFWLLVGFAIAEWNAPVLLPAKPICSTHKSPSEDNGNS